MKAIKYIFEAVFIYSIFLIIKLVGIKIGRKISSSIILNFGSFFRSKKIVNENITKALGNISEIEKKKYSKFNVEKLWIYFCRVFVYEKISLK